ncbi:MAG: response regulator transcription factor [Nitrospirae bacterium]|nr:response regulator transcription factor [Nitrospirota bacterium]
MIKVMIVDDHPIIREGLKKIISNTHDMTVTDEASSGDELQNKLRKNNYDVIILDISIPDKNGLDILKDLQSRAHKSVVLILSMHPEEQYAVRALKAGASGYLTKGGDPEELIKAIRKVYGGGKYLSPGLAEKLASDLIFNTDQPLHEKLSDREYQILTMLASGKSTKDIAGELFLSLPTISTYRSRILQKMNFKNNAEIIHYAIKNKLV